MFTKLLIANRGEIAVRVIRACKEMGIATVAVFSDADREALHVNLADESYCVGGALSKDSYLNADAILSAALVSGAEAIHPGYGFLAENADFAEACAHNHITFIGPDAQTIRAMGDKDNARKTMQAAGIPVIPGCDLVRDADHAREQAESIGYPLLIKARAGGGGRGIRRVNAPDELLRQYQAATAEALSAFGDGSVYMEKYLYPVKHIEVQILADAHGHVVSLGERDCSVQRNNQKLIEESPASTLSPEIRQQLADYSVQAGQAVGYRGAGTIEYLYTADGNAYFMEMNTRLQVEHPVTEMVTGLDLVKWQVRVAAGVPFDFTQAEVGVSGHAMECRINAEDAYNHFTPRCGTITMSHIPNGPWVRFDTAVYQGYTIPPFYDSMIGKLIVHAKTRDEAIRKMKAALCELILEGITHNADYLHELLSMPAFVEGGYTTDWLQTLTQREGKA